MVSCSGAASGAGSRTNSPPSSFPPPGGAALGDKGIGQGARNPPLVPQQHGQDTEQGENPPPGAGPTRGWDKVWDGGGAHTLDTLQPASATGMQGVQGAQRRTPGTMRGAQQWGAHCIQWGWRDSCAAAGQKQIGLRILAGLWACVYLLEPTKKMLKDPQISDVVHC